METEWKAGLAAT